jgi:hypothetical protein
MLAVTSPSYKDFNEFDFYGIGMSCNGMLTEDMASDTESVKGITVTGVYVNSSDIIKDFYLWLPNSDRLIVDRTVIDEGNRYQLPFGLLIVQSKGDTFLNSRFYERCHIQRIGIIDKEDDAFLCRSISIYTAGSHRNNLINRVANEIYSDFWKQIDED